MKGLISRTVTSGFLRTFLAGILVLLPIILTVVILNWLIRQIQNLLGPGSLLGDLFKIGGSFVFGAGQDHLAFWIGLLIVVFGIWGLGLIATLQARKTLAGAIDALFNRVPLLKTIYRPVAQVVRLLDARGEGELKGMQVVTVRLGNELKTDTLALRASRQMFLVDGESRSLIYIPTAPVPMGGFLLLVPTENVIPMPEMDVDDLMKVYFSIGTLASEAIPKSFQLAENLT